MVIEAGWRMNTNTIHEYEYEYNFLIKDIQNTNTPSFYYSYLRILFGSQLHLSSSTNYCLANGFKSQNSYQNVPRCRCRDGCCDVSGVKISIMCNEIVTNKNDRCSHNANVRPIALSYCANVRFCLFPLSCDRTSDNVNIGY